MPTNIISVIGGGLAGSEAAYQLADAIVKNDLDYEVRLYEMRPVKNTPAHHTGDLAELVCSNSLGSEFLTTARGVLIKEMQIFDSLIIKSALESKVPAGQALAVDRELFGKKVTEAITKHPKIKLVREEVAGTVDINQILEQDSFTVIATGPLTSEPMTKAIQKILNNEALSQASKSCLHFFDAASPIVSFDSINFGIAFKASRYGKGETDDYINCPFYNEDDYDNFYQALINAEKAPQKDFEKESMKYFEACLPVEVIASRGRDTLLFGPMKPVGLRDPRYPERKPVAVVQLRQDNVVGSLYNMVGFQTNLKWGEQKRVFGMIPGLENLDIVRYGVMHQNIYINSPLFLNNDMSLKSNLKNRLSVKQQSRVTIYFAGQITGVEGYTESAATGIIAARSIIHKILNKPAFALSRQTMMGALAHYISHADSKHFQPINSNWGILNIGTEEIDPKLRRDKKMRNEFLAERALKTISS